MNRTVGVVGLGKIGLPIAVNLLECGVTVLGHRRHPTEEFTELGGIQVPTSAEVARRCEVLITCLPDGSALLDAVTGHDGVVHGAHPGLVLVDVGMHSLAVKKAARDALDQVGVPMLDCPISGIPPQVLARKAVVFASGDRTVFDEHSSILHAFSNNVFYVGAFGAGSAVKCVANLMVAIHVVAAAEALTLAGKAGIEGEVITRVLGPSVASSAQFVARAPMMIDERFDPALSTIEQITECIEIIKELARDLDSPTPLLDAAENVYDKALVSGLGRKDVASIIKVLAERGG